MTTRSDHRVVTWMTTDEIAEHLQVSKPTIRRWMRAPDGIPFRQRGKGGTVRFDPVEVDRWFAGGEAAA